jgi:hypothetical protein
VKISLITIFVCSFFLATSLAHPKTACATLGEGPDSVAKDRKALSTVKRAATSHDNYTVHESSSKATTVREYLSPAGVVFAVAWNGMTPPDLSTLLGSYHQQYQSAKRLVARQHGHKRSRVAAEGVVVETWGHMRNLQGRAYVPELVPAGVAINEIH